MVFRILFTCALFFSAFEGLANVSYADFKSSANTIRSVNGSVVQLRRVESYDHYTKTAGVVIDAKDRFGNVVQQKKSLKISPSKFKSWSLACIRLGTACGAAAAVTASLAIATWYFDVELNQIIAVNDPWVFDPMSNVNRCPSKLLIIGTKPPPASCPSCAEVAIYAREINCFEVTASVTYFNAKTRSPELESWKTPNTTVSVMPSQSIAWKKTPTSFDPVTEYNHATDVYYRYQLNQAPSAAPKINVGSKAEATPEQLVEKIAVNPDAWQISPGVFPDIFESPSVSQDPVTDPDTLPVEPIVGGAPSNSDLIDISSIPSVSFDVSKYLEHESFLPAECPEPLSINIVKNTFLMRFDTVCNFANIIRPFIVFSGLIFWIMIVWRGLDL